MSTVNIKIPKIDYQVISLNIKEDGQTSQLGENDNIYMTVSNSPNQAEYIFQKSLGHGIEYNAETEKYDIEILSDDTKDMQVNKQYGYDITIYYEGTKPKQKVIGIFQVTDKYTFVDITEEVV